MFFSGMCSSNFKLRAVCASLGKGPNPEPSALKSTSTSQPPTNILTEYSAMLAVECWLLVGGCLLL